MKIFDTFMFFNENDLLDVRLHILYDYVDFFVMQESNITHSGKKKPLFFDRDRFAWAADKIVYNFHEGTPCQPDDDFRIERKQRQALYDFTKSLSHNDDDIMMISDVDEIPSREEVVRLKINKLPVRFSQDLYYYNIKCSRNKKWHGTIAARFDERDINIMRLNRTEDNTMEGGWHFSYFMTPEKIIEKLKAFSHARCYGNSACSELDHIKKSIERNENLLGKKDGNESPKELPKYVIDAMKPFPLFLGEA